MNDFLFYLTIISLLYYFFYYRPQQKKLNANPPLQQHQQTQTETIIETEPAIDELKSKNQELETKLSEDVKDLENTLDTLIKNIQDLNNSLN